MSEATQDRTDELSRRMRQLQRASAKSRWTGMSATERSAAMRAVRRRSVGKGKRAAKAMGEGKGQGQAGESER